jgi:hypothetical protein
MVLGQQLASEARRWTNRRSSLVKPSGPDHGASICYPVLDEQRSHTSDRLRRERHLWAFAVKACN